MTRVIDVHAHYVPQDYREALVAAGISRPDGSPVPQWSAASHLELMDELGIDTAVLSVSSPGPCFGDDAIAWAQRLNDEGARAVAEYPGRFGLLASLPMTAPEAAVKEAVRALDALWADGIILLTNVAGRYPAHPDFSELLAELNRRRAVVFLHPTAPPGYESIPNGRPAALIEYLFETTRAVVDLILSRTLERYPDIRWILPHNGSALTATADRVQLLTNFLLPVGSRPNVEKLVKGMYHEIGSSAPFPRQARTLVDMVGTQHLVFGTDTPYAPDHSVVENAHRICGGGLLRGKDLDDLLSTTALELFPRLA
ncbi:amidohydrolase family protein [Actinobaculum sp. 313]|uniref:amidohydrolase family protein n=1 Tax=Actinobaculum sp. 313 TaxID=2495645 RepID=UPI000D5295E2|nr:amidohydrolase family protein [Actinobaculum sp. 313]AWE42650.1 amidohydrolase [Actinobaculum sp. 313]